MYTAAVIVQIIISVLILTFILLQQGKGADAGALGGAGSQTVFGSSGSANFLSRTTAILITLFFIINLVIANLNSNGLNSTNKQEDIFRDIQAPVENPIELPKEQPLPDLPK